jgi:hypothetical protein
LAPEFNPPHLNSEYQSGRFGWLMSFAFFCLGAASLALFAAVFTLVSKGLVRNEASATTARPLIWMAGLTWLRLFFFYGSIIAFRGAPHGSITLLSAGQTDS